MISVESVSKRFGSFAVLTECSLDVAKGEIIVVCGPSGSGKSTLIKCINGLEPIDSGRITVDGTEVALDFETQVEPIADPGTPVGPIADPGAPVEVIASPAP